MSKISNIYDAIRAAVAAKMTGKTEIPNPYSLSDNAFQFLKNGYGVKIGEGGNGVLNVYREDNESRIFTIILTREVFKVDTDPTGLVTGVKYLIEDARTVKNDLLAFDQIALPTDIQKIDFVSASGVEFISADKFNLIYNEISFSVEYSETILSS